MSNPIDVSDVVKKSKKLMLSTVLKNYFKVSKDELLEGLDLANDDLIQFERLEEFGAEEIFFVTSLEQIPNNYLLNGDTLVKSGLYTRFVELEAVVDKNWRELFMAAVIVDGKQIFVFYRTPRNEHGYTGLGGWYTHTEDGGFIFEPLTNYLKFRYPNPQLNSKGSVELD